ncbi:MAG: glycoside hydrolase family 3 C-terminal domain-containing protein [Lachnospiraceae bacterium]
MKHFDVISKMTLEEKAALLSGKTIWETQDFPRLNIPSIFCADGPHGIRKQSGAGDHLGLNASLPATCFPTAAAVANSWDEELGFAIGTALGDEAVSLDVHVLLGPGLNIKRNPLCGRNFEYYSEDPYLSGKMAAAYVRGIQSRSVYACPKHFAVNSQEYRRMTVNSVLDERTLRELYLTGFEIAVKEGNAKALMSSYNEVNGEYANENQHLLQDILRKEWGFEGIVITDWGGSNDHVAGVAARSNLEMPAPGLASAREIIAAVIDGQLSQEAVDICVDDLVDAVLTLTSREKPDEVLDYNKHIDLARKAAQESAMLLKNEDGILPLKPQTTVAVVGDFAITPRYQGAGSSVVNTSFVENIQGEIQDYPVKTLGVVPGYRRSGEKDPVLVKEALELAEKADVVLFCFGLNEISEVEGMDRGHMQVPQNQIDLLTELARVNTNIIGILSAGAAVEMPWHDCLKGLLHGYLYGQAGASAMLNIITGKVNPSGRLSETYPIRYEDTPSYGNFPSTGRNAEYRESIFVGYRYFDTSTVRVLFHFGFGLSYTTFEYSNLQVSADGIEVTISNTGEIDGAEVVQMYIGLPEANVFRPEKELKGFKKVFIPKGEHVRVTIPFDEYSFRYWNVKTNGWEIEEGTYKVKVGASSADIRIQDEIFVAGTTSEYPYDPRQLPSYYSGLVTQVEDQEFTALLGKVPPQEKNSGELGENDAIAQMYYARSWLARFIYKRIYNMKRKSEKSGQPDLNILFVYNMPFRAIAKMTNGMVSMEMVGGILKVVNGHFFRGLGTIIGGFFRNSSANKKYQKELTKQ